MFENAANLQLRPGMLDAAVTFLRAEIVPVLRSQPGLLSLAVVPCPASGRVSVISIWESQAHARAVEACAAYRREMGKLDQYVARPTAACETIRLPWTPDSYNGSLN